MKDEDVRGVCGALIDTDDLFAHLVACSELDGSVAQRIERVRDELSGQLVAAEALADAGRPIVDVLRRAVDTARTGVGAVVATSAVPTSAGSVS
jgi:hypothetical protein